ncbi:MAG: RNA pyrophosphohydrolase [Acidiferrobacteraceae bacterium]
MIDENGYRPNVGIVLCNGSGQVFWARRRGQDGWQFPQGGILFRESPEDALFRELHEEIGLAPRHVQVMGRTREWLRYELPAQLLRNGASGGFRGQKQIWFLLRLTGLDSDVRLDGGAEPEFDRWRWIEYWDAVQGIVEFKRAVYRAALTELAGFLK